MERSRRNQALLGALGVVLVILIYRDWPSTDPGAPPATTEARGTRAPAGTAQTTTAPDVHLDALKADVPKPGAQDRNLFRFKPKPAPPAPAPVFVPPAPPPVAAPPPGPPPLPPIALKFMGIVEARERGLKVAALSDQYGVYYGQEGDTILGQYKILHIGAESIDIAYLDGRGRQTIRLSGS